MYIEGRNFQEKKYHTHPYREVSVVRHLFLCDRLGKKVLLLDFELTREVTCLKYVKFCKIVASRSLNE